MSHRILKKIVPIAAALVPVLFLIGCGDDKNTEPTKDPVVILVEEGWALYASGDYTGAIAKFQEAINTNSTYGDGYNGLGWSYLAIDSLGASLVNFDGAVAKGFVGADPQAGRCLVLNRADEYRQAVFAGYAAVATDSTFKLAGDPTIDIRDVRLAMAQSYFALGDYDESLEQVTIVSPGLGGTVNPNDAGFLVALINAIELLTQKLSVS